MSAAKPRRHDLGYLIGWFQPQTGGDRRAAEKLARDYQRKRGTSR